jgi:YesN/AraC family two-component response regulator
MIKVIIIEDEILIAERLKKMIESIEPEMKVIEVIDSVKEAISYLSDSIPDLIFLDLNMPVMNGWDFLEHFTTKIHKQGKQIKIIILSSTVDPSDYLRAKKYEVVIHFLSKPLTVEMLKDLKTE